MLHQRNIRIIRGFAWRIEPLFHPGSFAQDRRKSFLPVGLTHVDLRNLSRDPDPDGHPDQTSALYRAIFRIIFLVIVIIILNFLIAPALQRYAESSNLLGVTLRSSHSVRRVVSSKLLSFLSCSHVTNTHFKEKKKHDANISVAPNYFQLDFVASVATMWSRVIC